MFYTQNSKYIPNTIWSQDSQLLATENQQDFDFDTENQHPTPLWSLAFSIKTWRESHVPQVSLIKNRHLFEN